MATLTLSRPLPAHYRARPVHVAHNDARHNRMHAMVQRPFELPLGPGPWTMGRWVWLNPLLDPPPRELGYGEMFDYERSQGDIGGAYELDHGGVCPNG